MATNRVSPKKGKVVDIPTVPTVGTATAGSESATVAYTAATVGGPVTTFTALSNPGSITGTGTSPITVSGLTAGTAYTFTVRGSNATGNGEYSSASGSVTPTVSTSYESIQTVSVGSGGTSSIDFTSIPSTFKHLQIRGIGRLSDSGTAEDMRMQFNADTGSNYIRVHYLYGDGSGAFAGSGTTNSYITLFRMTANTATSGVFGTMVLDLLDYQNTNKYKTTKALAGFDRNGAGEIFLESGAYMSTNAVSSIKLYSNSASNFLQYTQFALYGIKG